MAKIHYHSAVESIRGKIQGLRFSKRGKQGVVSAAPDKPAKKRKISEREEATQVRTLIGNSYARGVQRSPETQELWARYKAVSLARGCPSFSVAIKDYNNPPIVEAIDISAYRGQPGQIIRIRARDDFEVRDVTVTLKSGATVLETGLATRQPDDTWHYAATTAATGAVTLEATARDWPNHTASKSVSVDLDAAAVVPDDGPRTRLMRRIRQAAQRRGSYLLRTGRTRVNFFDKYRLAHDPVLLREIAAQLVPLVPPGTELLAGFELGGVPVATHVSHLTGKPLVLLRKAPRDWGTTLPAEGGELAGRHVLPIVDVITTGQQLATALRPLRSAGAIVTHALCILDEQHGAPALLQKQAVALTRLFNAFELIA